MKPFSALVASALLLLSPVAFADDLPSAKDPATQSDPVENNHTDLKTEKMENKFEISKVMSTCLAAHNNDKELCGKNAMAECTKSMSKADCRKAVKSAKK